MELNCNLEKAARKVHRQHKDQNFSKTSVQAKAVNPILRIYRWLRSSYSRYDFTKYEFDW